MTKYKKNFLDDVIFRVDFSTILDLTENKIPATFENKILKIYPIKEPVIQKSFKIKKKEGKFISSSHDEITWIYKNKKKNIFIELKYNFLVINFKKYYFNFEDFNEKVLFILDKLFSSYQIFQIERMGLRYIDKILLPSEKNFFDWNKYLNPDLIKPLDFIEDKKQLRRTMQIFELSLENDINISFKCGIFNSWYPDKLLQKEFVIDTDCYTPVVFDKSEIKDKLINFNEIATKFFEKTITNQFRKILNE